MKYSFRQLRFAGFILAGIVAVCDQLTKKWVVAAAHANELPVIVTSFFNITLVFNKGISFGMLAQTTQNWIIMLLPVGLAAITAMLCYWLIKAEEKHAVAALGLIIGGAAGNLIDRAKAGVVTDFLDFHISYYHWPAFNLADSSIFIGVVIFVITNIIGQKAPEELAK